MHAFVTGATGYIGRAVTLELLARGHRVSALAHRAPTIARVQNMGCVPIIGNAAEPPAWSCEEPDVVLHLASEPFEMQGTSRHRRVEVGGARGLATKFPRAHFLYASSASVYGSSNAVLSEEAPLSPIERSARVKREVEELITPVPRRTIFRLGTVYPGGPFGRLVMGPIANHLFRLAGSGENHLSLVWLDDVVSAFVAAAERSITGTYNLADDEPLSWRAAADAIASRLSAPAPEVRALWLARLLLGREVAAWEAADVRLANARAKDAGFSFGQPSFRRALDVIM
jgi:nucleoside-diphosphate-sugar epimerase